jgi:hypothetical protein
MIPSKHGGIRHRPEGRARKRTSTEKRIRTQKPFLPLLLPLFSSLPLRPAVGCVVRDSTKSRWHRALHHPSYPQRPWPWRDASCAGTATCTAEGGRTDGRCGCGLRRHTATDSSARPLAPAPRLLPLRRQGGCSRGSRRLHPPSRRLRRLRWCAWPTTIDVQSVMCTCLAKQGGQYHIVRRAAFLDRPSLQQRRFLAHLRHPQRKRSRRGGGAHRPHGHGAAPHVGVDGSGHHESAAPLSRRADQAAAGPRGWPASQASTARCGHVHSIYLRASGSVSGVLHASAGYLWHIQLLPIAENEDNMGPTGNIPSHLCSRCVGCDRYSRRAIGSRPSRTVSAPTSRCRRCRSIAMRCHRCHPPLRRLPRRSSNSLRRPTRSRRCHPDSSPSSSCASWTSPTIPTSARASMSRRICATAHGRS